MRDRRIASGIEHTCRSRLAFEVTDSVAYFGLILSFCRPVLGDWVDMPALTYAVWSVQSALLAPQWMLGGSIYTFLSEANRRQIIPITIGIYGILAFVL